MAGSPAAPPLQAGRPVGLGGLSVVEALDRLGCGDVGGLGRAQGLAGSMVERLGRLGAACLRRIDAEPEAGVDLRL